MVIDRLDRTLFFEALLAGDSEGCQGLVARSMAQGATTITIYEQLFRNALYRVGDDWCRGAISVAVEHCATAIVEALMTSMFERTLLAPGGRHALSATVGSSLHQVGGRMVADVLESQGWTCSFLAGDQAPDAIADRAQREGATLVALSTTLSQSLPTLTRQVQLLRARLPGVTIIAGGLALRERGAEICSALDQVQWVSELQQLQTFVPGHR